MKPVYIGIEPPMPEEEAIELVLHHGHRFVARAVAEPGELQDAIMTLALSGQRVWTPDELDAINAKLDTTNAPLSNWLRTIEEDLKKTKEQ